MLDGDPYEVLGVEKDASLEEIKRAYHSKAREKHPDCGGSKEEFALISRAYGRLIDPEMRDRYDRGDLGDEVDEDPVFAKLVSMAAEAFTQSDDPISWMQSKIRKDISEYKGQQRLARSTADKLRRRVDLLKAQNQASTGRTKEVVDSMVMSIEAEVKKADDYVKLADNQMGILNSCLDVLKNVKYSDGVLRPSGRSSFGEFGSSWSGSGLFTTG